MVDKQKYLKSNEWKELKEKYKKNKCKLCGANKELHLHHHTYEGKNSLLITLCKKCHYKLHFEKKKRKKVGMGVTQERLMTLFYIKTRRKLKPTPLKYLRKITKKEKEFSCTSRYSKFLVGNMIKRGTSIP